MKLLYLLSFPAIVVLGVLSLTVPASAFDSGRCNIRDPDSGTFGDPARLIRGATFEIGSENAAHWPEHLVCAYYQRGLIYQFIGDYDDAIKDYTSALGWMSDFPEVRAARGDAYEQEGQHALAEQDFATLSGQSNPLALNNQCWQRAVRGKPLDRALVDCTLAVKLAPDLPYAWDTLCLVHYRLADYADAISDCNTAIKLYGGALDRNMRAITSVYVRGLAKLKTGNQAGGNADISLVASEDPRIATTFAIWGVGP